MKTNILIYLLIAIWLPIAAGAQTSDSLLNELGAKWNNAKAYTLQIATLMPEAAYHFKPVADEMTFGEQLLHIANNINWLTHTYLSPAADTPKAVAVPTTKEGIINLLRAAYDTALAAHYRLTETQLQEVVPFFAKPLTRRQILVLLHDHQTHHVGQLIVYLRLQGIKPPDYIGW